MRFAVDIPERSRGCGNYVFRTLDRSVCRGPDQPCHCYQLERSLSVDPDSVLTESKHNEFIDFDVIARLAVSTLT